MKSIIISALALLCAVQTYGQSVLNGTISDDQTGEALSFSKVRNTTNNAVAIANEAGQFTIAINNLNDSLIFRSAGYGEYKTIAKNAENIRLKPDALNLDQVIVSHDREAQLRKDAPMAISTVNAQQIADNKPTSIDQVLNQNAGVHMVDLGNEQHTMSIRRPIDYGASYLYLEDGVPIRTSGVFNHNALLEINMANVSSIEIIRGPASSLYGSESIGGAINFITQRPSTTPTAGIAIRANNLGYKRVDLNASNTFKKFGIRLSGYYANQLNGVREHSDFNKLALNLNAQYRFNEHSVLSWSNSLIDYYADMSGSLDSTDFFEGNYNSNHTFTNRDVLSFRSKISYKRYWDEKGITSAVAYYRNNSIKQTPSYRVKDDFKPWNGSGNPNLAHGEENDNSFNSYGIILQHKAKFKWLKSSLVAGASVDYSPNTYRANYIEINKNDAGIYENYTSRTDSLLANYQADLLNVAGYLQGSIRPIKNLNIIAAIRFDQFIYDFNNHLDSNAFTGVLDGRNTFQQFTPKFGATYDLGKNGGLYANYGQGFVPPQVTELYRGKKIASLLPVYYHNYEFGAWVALFKKKVKLDVSLYRMDGQNEIISVLQDDGSTEKENAGRTTHQGIEYTLVTNPIKSLVFRFSGTNAIHKFTNYIANGDTLNGNLMAQSPKWVINSQITWKPSFLTGARISLEWQHVSKYFLEAANTKTYKGYDVLNLRMGYEWKGAEIWVNVMNLGDELYSTVARASKWGQSYSLGNPRSFTVGLAYQFKKK